MISKWTPPERHPLDEKKAKELIGGDWERNIAAFFKAAALLYSGGKIKQIHPS